MPPTRSPRIDTTNELLWQKRYTDFETVARKSAINLRQAEKMKYPRGIAGASLNIAAVNFLQSRNKIALRYLAKAFRWFRNNRLEKGYVRSLLLKGSIFESFGYYEQTLKLWLEAWKTSREINDIESEGEACSQLGLIYLRLSNFPKSLEFFNKGLKIRESLKDENAMASSLNRIGMVLRQIKQYDQSIEYYFRSLEIRRRNAQKAAIPWTFLGIASTYEEMARYPEAIEYYEMGMEGGDKRCTLQCMIGAARVFGQLHNTAGAEMLLKESLKLARELKSSALIAEIYFALAANYEIMTEPGKALASFKQYLKAKESFNSSEIQSRLSNIEVTHAIEKSEQEKEIYRLKHVELKKAYDLIEEKNMDITANIQYATRIQQAMLPDMKNINGLERRSFVLYIPKDVVSGDFYWFARIDKKLVIAAADCTGHGVPGALMSMLGISFLEEIVNTRKITDTSRILEELSREVVRALHQKGDRQEARDGMDIALCILDKNTMQYSGAHNNLYLIRNNGLIEYKADWLTVGFNEPDKRFSRHIIRTLPGDIIYLFSDGYADQFGGPGRKKFRYSNLKSLLLRIHDKPMRDQKKALEKEFYKWKGIHPQIDDVLIIGYRI